MNGTHLSKVKSGDSLVIPAPTYNSFVDAARAHRARQHALSRTVRPELRQGVIVPIKNNSGADRGRYDVLGLDGSLFSATTDLASFQREIAMKGVSPVAGTHEGNFAVLLEPIASGGVGQAAIAGQTIVKVNVPDTDAEAFKFADISNGQTGYLVKSAEGSARVVSIESGTGTKWAIVSFGNIGPSKLLSAMHTDTDAEAEAVAAGSIITGLDNSPDPSTWGVLPIGAENKVLTVVDIGGTLVAQWAPAPVPAGTGTLIAHTFEVPAMTAAGEFVINDTVDCRGKFLAIRAWYWDNALGGNVWWEGALHSEHPTGYDVESSPAADVTIEEFSASNFFLEVDKDTGHLKWRWLQYGGTVYLACEVRVMNLPGDTAS